jgi:hypothetical protein
LPRRRYFKRLSSLDNRKARPRLALLRPLHVDLHVHIAAGGVGVGADFLVRFLGERGEVGLRKSLVGHMQLDGKAEAAAVARADRHIGGDARLAGVLLVLLADIIERAAEAGGIAGNALIATVAVRGPRTRSETANDCAA